MPPLDIVSGAAQNSALQSEPNPENSRISPFSTATPVDEIAAAVELAKPRGAAKNFFAKSKDMRGFALARAYPLHLLLKDNPDGTERLLKSHEFPHRKRRPNRANTALIAVIIALNPANDDDHADCCEEAYALRAFAERGVPAADFEREYQATTILSCKEFVRSAKRSSSPRTASKITEEPTNPSIPNLESYSGKPYFAAYYVGPDGIFQICKVVAPADFCSRSSSEMSDQSFQRAYRQFLRDAQCLAEPSSVLTEPGDAAMSDDL
jgi:hypothetical protein